MRRRSRSAVEALCVLLAAGGTGLTAASAGGTTHIRWEHHHPLPDRQATPGSVFAHAGPATFCHSGYTAKVRNVSESTRRAVFAEYDISYAKRAHYEVDHLIPLELGGSNSIRNLWPERGAIPNRKDGVETQLHDLVCEHKLSTGTARRAIAVDWVRALHKYGHTSYVYERSGSASGSGSGHACTRTSSGSCIRGGEFCPQASYGHNGWDAGGRRWVCKGDHSHPQWKHP